MAGEKINGNVFSSNIENLFRKEFKIFTEPTIINDTRNGNEKAHKRRIETKSL